MGAGHVPELCCAVLDPTFGSMHDGGPSVMTQRGQVEKICVPSLIRLIRAFKFEHYLGYPKITKDIMVYAGFRDARRDIPDPSPAQSTQTRKMKKTWMPDLTRRRWSKPSTRPCSC